MHEPAYRIPTRYEKIEAVPYSAVLVEIPHLPIRHPAAWALVVLSFFCLILAWLVLRVRHENAKKIYRQHFADHIPRERMLFASGGFYFGFATVRVITHMIRAGVGPFHDLSAGGRHIHHLVWGILLLLLVGYCWLWQVSLKRRFWSRLLAFLYGIGAALTLDEFALWLNLRDVYWEREGRESIDAILLFSALLCISVFGGRFFQSLAREALGSHRKRQPDVAVHQP